MDEMMTLLNDALKETSEMKRAFIDLAPNTQKNMIIIGVMIVVGALLALFGLKLSKLFTVIFGFGVGAAIGFAITQIVHPAEMTGLIILFGCAIFVAVMALFLRKLGVFLTVFVASMLIAVMANMPQSVLIMGIYALVSLVLAILAAIFTEPLMIVVTEDIIRPT